MAKNKAVARSSRKHPKGAGTAPVSEVNDDDKRVRGKPVSLHPLSFKQALGLLIRTPPPVKKARKKPRKRAP